MVLRGDAMGWGFTVSVLRRGDYICEVVMRGDYICEVAMRDDAIE